MLNKKLIRILEMRSWLEREKCMSHWSTGGDGSHGPGEMDRQEIELEKMSVC